jgi:hypothetical protein
MADSGVAAFRLISIAPVEDRSGRSSDTLAGNLEHIADHLIEIAGLAEQAGEPGLRDRVLAAEAEARAALARRTGQG